MIRSHAQLKRPLSIKFVPDTQSKEWMIYLIEFQQKKENKRKEGNNTLLTTTEKKH